MKKSQLLGFFVPSLNFCISQEDQSFAGQSRNRREEFALERMESQVLGPWTSPYEHLIGRAAWVGRV